MRKLLILLTLVMLVSCNDNVSEPPEKRTYKSDINVLMTIASYENTEIYENETLEKIVESDLGNVYKVVDLQTLDNRIVSYKIYLGPDRYGYVKANEFYIIELMDESLAEYMKPQIDLDRIRPYQALNPRTFVYSPLKFDFLLDRQITKENINLEVDQAYFLSAVSYDQYGNRYNSEEMVYYSEDTLAPITVYDSLSESHVILNEYMILEDYQDKLLEYVVSYEDGNFTSYYTIEEEGGTGYILDAIDVLEVHKSLLIETNGQEYRYKNASVELNKIKGLLTVEDSVDNKHLFNMQTGASIDFKGRYRYLTNEALSQDFIALTGKRREDQVGLEIRDKDTLELLCALPSKYYLFTRFDANDTGFTFEMSQDQFDYWPSGGNERLSISGHMIKEGTSYELSVDNSLENHEPLLKNVPLYEFKGETDNQITSFNSDEIAQVDNERLIDIVDGRVVYWFHIITNEGQSGYSYRPLFNFEEIRINIESDYEVVLSDGSVVPINTLLPDRYSDLIINNDLVVDNLLSYTLVNSYDDNKYYVDIASQAYGVYEKPVNPWSSDMMVSYIGTSSYGIPDTSQVVFYKQVNDHLEAYLTLDFRGAACYDLICVDEDTISAFIKARVYGYYEEEPAVFKRIDGRWTLNTDLAVYDMEMLE